MAQITLNSSGVASNGTLALQTNGTTPAITIDASQNVGIGTSSPLEALDVFGNAVIGRTAASGYVTLNFVDAGTGSSRYASIRKNFDSPFDLRIRASASTNVAPIIFETSNNTERMRIESSGNVLVTSAASLGYGTGSGGSVTQATSKGTGVTINKANGRITMNNAALGAGGTAVFLVSNSLVASTDTVVLNVNDSLRGDLYNAWVWYVIGGGFYVALKNTGTLSYSDAVVLNFAVIKATTS